MFRVYVTGLALFLFGCASTIDSRPTESTAVVYTINQRYSRHDISVERFPQTSSYDFSSFAAHEVEVGNKLRLITQATINDNRDWPAIGVYSQWDLDESFRGYMFGPFEPGKCYLAYFEPVRLTKPLVRGRATHDYNLEPRWEEVLCGQPEQYYGPKDFNLL